MRTRIALREFSRLRVLGRREPAGLSLRPPPVRARGRDSREDASTWELTAAARARASYGRPPARGRRLSSVSRHVSRQAGEPAWRVVELWASPARGQGRACGWGTRGGVEDGWRGRRAGRPRLALEKSVCGSATPVGPGPGSPPAALHRKSGPRGHPARRLRRFRPSQLEGVWDLEWKTAEAGPPTSPSAWVGRCPRPSAATLRPDPHAAAAAV